MADSKQHAPDSLKYQWRLLGLVLRADWATGLDKSVAYEIIDNYRKERKDSRASLRYLEKATGATRPNVIASVRRLVERGPFGIALAGGGTRPTAYTLHFDKVAENASGIVDDTASGDEPSGIVGNTTVVSQAIPLEDASGIAGNTESVLQVDGLQAGLLDRMSDDCAAPLAPPLAGLSAATAGTAQEELAQPTFEALWRAYDYAKGKKEARAAWSALPPDTNLAAVIEAAKAWQESWAAQGKPDAPRFTLARWLRDERFDEDAPRGFQKVERAKPKTISKSKPAKVAMRTTARVTSADVVETGDVTELRITATDADGCAHERFIEIQHPDEETQFAGQRQLSALVHAAGLEQISDSAELLGRTIILTSDGYTAPTTRPDDEPPLPVEPVPEARPQPAPCDATRREPTEWEQRKAEQWKQEAGRREWDAAHPELFEDKPAPLPPQPDDWPAWMDDAA